MISPRTPKSCSTPSSAVAFSWIGSALTVARSRRLRRGQQVVRGRAKPPSALRERLGRCARALARRRRRFVPLPRPRRLRLRHPPCSTSSSAGVSGVRARSSNRTSCRLRAATGLASSGRERAAMRRATKRLIRDFRHQQPMHQPAKRDRCAIFFRQIIGVARHFLDRIAGLCRSRRRKPAGPQRVRR